MPKKKAKLPVFCSNCGQQVKGEVARKAANPVAVFCCESGDRLEANGTCPNPACPWYQLIPQC